MAVTSHEDVWCALSGQPLEPGALSSWVVQPDCGAVVTFTGTARDHAAGRTEVTRLEYEAYEEQALPKLRAVADEVRERWPSVGRVALHHRVGTVGLTEAAVVVAVSTPHRQEAFDAAKWAIDTLKAVVPIWKKEYHAGGESWGTEAQHLDEIDARPSTTSATGG